MRRASSDDRLAPWQLFLLMATVFAVYVGYGIVLPDKPPEKERHGSERFTTADAKTLMRAMVRGEKH